MCRKNCIPQPENGHGILKCQADFTNFKDVPYANDLIRKSQLIPDAVLKYIHNGIKQKTVLVNGPLLILDDPVTGLASLCVHLFPIL